ncbi:hypothetical protein FISHEDRAFT_73220 [Fistulina hepatica ATCC 64428]|uniref:ABC transporter domain-containing protein n=1 Tax=Fistulina hepatica ATCC 64428 TaxID=1128425 RepID=A0A0D7AD25_9AGAR|nr:hypothetical protein FISHEDRAFT_73220 [Fistulina hepatica ATCC 64428]
MASDRLIILELTVRLSGSGPKLRAAMRCGCRSQTASGLGIYFASGRAPGVQRKPSALPAVFVATPSHPATVSGKPAQTPSSATADPSFMGRLGIRRAAGFAAPAIVSMALSRPIDTPPCLDITPILQTAIEGRHKPKKKKKLPVTRGAYTSRAAQPRRSSMHLDQAGVASSLLLRRFYDPTADWSGVSGSQERTLFNTTIQENVEHGLADTQHERLSGEERFKMVKHAFKIANADVFVSKLPNGYNTVLGERAALLSGEPKQRIAIARTIVADYGGDKRCRHAE